MNRVRVFFSFSLAGICALSLARAEVSLELVAVSGAAAPGFGSNAVFSQFSCLALADDGRLVFSGNATGTGITTANRSGVWAGLPGALNLIARAGNAAPGADPGVTFKFFNGVNIDSRLSLAFVADLQGPGIDPNAPGSLWVAALAPAQTPIPPQLLVPDSNHLAGVAIVAKSYSSGCNGEALIHDTNVLACGMDLSGTGVDFTNNEAILEGANNNWAVAVRSGSPAPGTSKVFSSLVTETKSLAPDGKIAFKSNEGLWVGNAGALQAAALTGGPAPVSSFGSGATYSFLSELIEINARDEVAFGAYLAGPGLNNTNAQFVVAGPLGGLRAIAQSGQPAPGIPGAVFGGYNPSTEVFSDILIGTDGAVAFVAAFSTNGYDYGLWFSPAQGPVRLIARSGGQAPGTPQGVVFTSTFQFLSPFEEIYLNARGQIAFRANLSGPGVGSTNSVGIWLAEPEGTVNLLVRSGGIIDVGGSQRAVGTVTFGSVGVPVVGGPEDGRAVPLNDVGEVLFSAYLGNPSGQGLFLARNGLLLGGAKAGANFQIQFPTLAGKHYRVDSTTNLSSSSTWTVFQSSLPGTGSEVTLTDTNATSLPGRFYRVVRTD